MASWIVHLRIADQLLDQIPDLKSTEFVVGNIAPDSGIPNEDWSAYTPSPVLSHFKRMIPYQSPFTFLFFSPGIFQRKSGQNIRKKNILFSWATWFTCLRISSGLLK